MRVLLVVSSARLAGTERHVVDLAAGLREAGVEAEVACIPGGPGLDAALRARGIPVHPFALAGPALAPATLGLARLARRFDVVHSHLTVATVAATVAGALARRPVVETRHFLVLAHETGHLGRRLSGRLLRAGLRRGLDLTLAPSRAALARVGGPATLVPHGVAVGNGTDPPAPPGEGRFVTVGRLDRDRNAELLVRAFARARSQLPPTSRLTVVGDGTERPALERLSRQLGVDDAVAFLSWVEDPSAHLESSDVYLAAPFLPVPESFGLSVLEAMRAGRPVVAEPGGGASELVEPGVTGLLVPPRPEAWAGAMARLASDPVEAARLGAAGRRRAEREFSLDQMVSRTVDAYRSVVAVGPPVERVGR